LGKDLRRLLRRPLLAVSAALANPTEAWVALQDRLAARRETPPPPGFYEADADWEQRLRRRLDLAPSCEYDDEFWKLWPEVVDEMRERGVRVGPGSFKNWNDGDAGFVRAIWLLVRHLRPRNVVETGVAHGVTSRFILEALEKNGSGHLWSIDHPPLEPEWREEIGVAVGGRHPDRWSYIEGSSRVHLPRLISRLGGIDLFIHDSLHSEANVLFEIGAAWDALPSNCAIVVDDIDTNWGFHRFTQSLPADASVVCEAEPIEPDLRRANRKGLFGLILKPRR
jgi:hypothetical protein